MTAGAAFTDYKVAFRSEAFIAEAASKCRAIGTRPGLRYVDLKVVLSELEAHGVESIFRIKGTKSKGRLKIELIENDQSQPEAYVVFSPRLTLRVQEDVWTRFQAGHSKEQEIIAHEIGHIMLHDDNAKPYSQDGSRQIAFADQEDSAEWQAHRFADHVLVPTELAQQINDVDRIAVICNVTDAFAAERLEAVRAIKKPLNKLSTDPCPDCGSDLIFIDGQAKICSWCGSSQLMGKRAAAAGSCKPRR
ncbi:ImmA/IrrE family metallo-endopeptidase [Rhodopseudomonas sp. HC1]|uniref:ImmA/IrrE family metallo-endopeptidase n=1 Tax=Rhodopseudomonas infernalis TaxID=2897386 RepID=UPI001EE786E4|nr:ImmA/IrrE family metallo-endopeptidase [Rhodopseudomonas infernalis]MCG6204144.1 ImmA/IrrE family metallo-endopeptidase [Rhodopseudomonas infernalis]